MLQRMNVRGYVLEAMDRNPRVVARLAPKFHAMALLSTFGVDFREDSDDEASDNGEVARDEAEDVVDVGDEQVISEVHCNNSQEAPDVEVVSGGESSVLSEGPVLTRSQRRAREAERCEDEVPNGGDDEVGVVTRSQARATKS